MMTSKINYEFIVRCLYGRLFGGRFCRGMTTAVYREMIEVCRSRGTHTHHSNLSQVKVWASLEEDEQRYRPSDVGAVGGHGEFDDLDAVRMFCISPLYDMCNNLIEDDLRSWFSYEMSERDLLAELDPDHAFNIRLDWNALSCCQHISLGFINQHLDLPWNWANLTMRSDLTYEFIMEHFDRFDWLNDCIRAGLFASFTLQELCEVVKFIHHSRPLICEYLLDLAAQTHKADHGLEQNEEDVIIEHSIPCTRVMSWPSLTNIATEAPQVAWDYKWLLLHCNEINIKVVLIIDGFIAAYKELSERTRVSPSSIEYKGVTLADLARCKEHGLVGMIVGATRHLPIDELTSCFVGIINNMFSGSDVLFSVLGYTVHVRKRDLLARADATEEFLELIQFSHSDDVAYREILGHGMGDIDLRRPFGPRLIARGMCTTTDETPLMVLGHQAGEILKYVKLDDVAPDFFTKKVMTYDQLVWAHAELERCSCQRLSLPMWWSVEGDDAENRRRWNLYRRTHMGSSQYARGLLIKQVLERGVNCIGVAGLHVAHEAVMDELALITE
jgi:hypothetical protein